MGTDIHLYVDRLTDLGFWEWVKPPYKREYEYNEEKGFYYTYSDWWKREDAECQYDPCGRNYEIFAFLADVRNGYGFAGVPIFKPIEPQFAGRGLPPGIPFDEEGNSLEEDINMWLGYHDFTWATLEELRNASWRTHFKQVGVIPADDYQEFKKLGYPPRGWSGGITGPGIHVFSEKEYTSLKHLDDEIEPYIKVSWGDSPLLQSGFYRWIYSDWMDNVVYSVGQDENRVRITMGFDS